MDTHRGFSTACGTQVSASAESSTSDHYPDFDYKYNNEQLRSKEEFIEEDDWKL